MAENTNYIGVSMGMDVTDLKAGLSEANKQIQLANSKFKAASSGMDDWTKSTEGLTAKVEQLDSVLKAQKAKLAGLTAEYEKVVAEQGEGSEAARKLEVQINNQQAVVNKTQREFDNYTETLERAKKGEIDLNSVALKAGKAIEKAGKQSDEAADDVEELGDKAEEAGDGFTIAKGAIAGFIGNGLTALAGSIKDGISNLLGLAESTREVRENMSKLETGFTTAGLTAKDASNTYRELYGVLGDEGQATEAAAHLAQLANNQEDLSKWTNIATGVYATFGDSLPIEGLTEAANETAKTGQLTGGLADALNWAGESEDEFQAKLDAASSEQERQALITDTLNGLYSEQADKYKEVNGEVIKANKSQADLSETVASFGAKVEPITTKVKEGFNGILEKVLELVKDVDFSKIEKSVEDGFQYFIDDVMPKIVDGFTWIVDNKDGIIAGIVGIGAAFLAFKVVTLIQGVVSALKSMTLAQYALNLAMSLNPIGLIVAAIAGLVAAFVVLWNKSDSFRNFWISIWEAIKKAAGAVADWFSEAWTAVIDWFSEAWQNVSDFFSNLWQGIKDTVNTVVSWIKENWQAMLLFLINPLAGIFKYCYDHFEGFRNFVDGVVSAVKKFFSDLWQKLKDGAKSAVDGVKNVFSTVSNWFNTKLIQPVSSFFTNMWTKLKTGASNAWEGIKSVFSKVGSFFSDTFTKAWTAVKNIFSTGGKIFDGIKEGITSAFKNIVNAIIRGINKVVAVPFNGINTALRKIKNVDIAGLKPFSGLISEISVPSIPELYRGGVLKRGQVGLLEGSGAEAVVPLEKNLGWIKKIAEQLSDYLDVGGVKNSLSDLAYAGATTGRGTARTVGNGGYTVVNTGMTVNYNGTLSRKELKRIETDHYTLVKTKLKQEGAIK